MTGCSSPALHGSLAKKEWALATSRDRLLEPKVYYSRIDDIDKVSQEPATLKSRIVQFLIGPKSEWQRYSSAILGQTKEE